VLVYAQPGSGRRASLYTDYTFAVWNRLPRDASQAQDYVAAVARREAPSADALQLVPFAKAYSGLTDEEIGDVDRLVRRTTVEKFGPVRSLAPSLVCEIGFEGIARSARHRSGVAVRFPAHPARACRQAVARGGHADFASAPAPCRTGGRRVGRLLTAEM
jgi:DNA ligase-1